MKRVLFLLIALAMVMGPVVSPAFAGGDKVQHENGAADAPGPGANAQGNQVGDD